MKSHVQDRFHDFYHTWLTTLQQILHHLIHYSKLQNDVVQLQHLVNTTTSHIKQYYTVKWAEAHEDVLPFFSPTWLTPLENASSWITGWKPSSIFRLLQGLKTNVIKTGAEGEPEKASGHGSTRSNRSNRWLDWIIVDPKCEAVDGWTSSTVRLDPVLTTLLKTMSFHMSEEQVKKMEELRMRVRMEEEKVEREMERLQVAMADHKVVEIAKISSRTTVSGEEEVAAVKGVLEGLERMMKGADCVRLKALKGVLDFLTPLQCVEFLAAFIALQLRLRQWGKKENMGMLHVRTHVE